MSPGAMKTLKILHSTSAIGLMGGLLVWGLLAASPAQGTPAYAELRAGLDLTQRLLLLPSMAVCVVSGFISWLAHRPYRYALWASLKGVSGLAVAELTVHLWSQGNDATAAAAALDAGALAHVRHVESVVLGALLVLTLANIVLGVWRPRFTFIRGLPEAASGPPPATDDA